MYEMPVALLDDHEMGPGPKEWLEIGDHPSRPIADPESKFDLLASVKLANRGQLQIDVIQALFDLEAPLCATLRIPILPATSRDVDRVRNYLLPTARWCVVGVESVTPLAIEEVVDLVPVTYHQLWVQMMKIPKIFRNY